MYSTGDIQNGTLSFEKKDGTDCRNWSSRDFNLLALKTARFYVFFFFFKDFKCIRWYLQLGFK